MLTTVDWWRDLAALLARQALQVITPVLAAIVATGGDVDLTTAVVALAGALAVTLIGAVIRALRDQTDPTVLGAVVRAGAGVLTGLAITDLASLAAIDWIAAGIAAGAAMLLSLLHWYADPPVTGTARQALASRA